MTTTTTEKINGKEIPVAVHVPVNNGEASNNVGLKDMSPQQNGTYLTVEAYREMRKRDAELDSMNLWSVGATIMSKRVELGGIKYQIIDGKKSDIPLLDDELEPLRYPSKFHIQISYFGYGEELQVSKDIYEALDVGQKYLLKAHRGPVTSFGQTKADMIVDSFEYR